MYDKPPGLSAAGVPSVGQPIMAAAGFQPALCASRKVNFRRQRRSRRGIVPRPY
jgi:hypothetical protein